ncbi:MAG: hypothetical protein IPO97_09500, partial [Sphingomonadales bacterium]|nr:hypothetical protein [Sphingomonadales bacterium]
MANGFYAASGLPANGGVTNFGSQAFQKRRTSNNREFRDQIEQFGISGQIDWDLGGPELTYIAGYRSFKAQSSQESDFVSLNVFSTSDNTSSSTANSINSVGRIKTITNELRISGNALSDKLQYLFGGYYSDEKICEQGFADPWPRLPGLCQCRADIAWCARAQSGIEHLCGRRQRCRQFRGQQVHSECAKFFGLHEQYLQSDRSVRDQ